jgi:type VI secretion system protein ImpG
MDDGLDDILAHYQRELLYLRGKGAAFARLYPKVAARLEFDGGESADPQVERLIESFAFLTARLQRQIDNEFVELPAALLEVLYPHLVNPLPSMAIACFETDAAQARAAGGFTIPARAQLYADAASPDGTWLTCRFQTIYPITLWPVGVTAASFAPVGEYGFLDSVRGVASVLRLRLECQGQQTFADVAPPSLRFHIAAGSIVSTVLYELLVNNLLNVAIVPAGAREPIAMLPPEAVCPIGFAPDEGLLPYPQQAHLGYRLIQEYFCFPEKFLFFDLGPLPSLGIGKAVDILFLLDTVPRHSLPIGAESFVLGCTPIINLFPKTTEPISLDQTRLEYLLLPDNRYERSTEIHSILKVSAVSSYEDDSAVYEPFYSYTHDAMSNRHGAFWIARRQPTVRPDVPGTEILISFVDLYLNRTRPATQTVFAHTLATNRGIAEQIAAGTLMRIEVDAPLRQISCLSKPTRQLSPPMRGETFWQLVSHLSLNHLSLVGGEESLAALREILRLYSFVATESTEKQIAGIRSMSSRTVVRRVGGEAWRGFCRGTEVTLEFDESLFVGASGFLLSAVLSRFLALHAAVDSFAQLVVKSRQREEVWRVWPAMAGEKMVL